MDATESETESEEQWKPSTYHIEAQCEEAEGTSRTRHATTPEAVSQGAEAGELCTERMIVHHHQSRAADHAEMAPETPLVRTLATATTPNHTNNADTHNKSAFEADAITRMAALRIVDSPDDAPPPSMSQAPLAA